MTTDKNLGEIKAIVLRHKWLMESDEDQVTPAFFTGKGGREPHGLKSSGVIEKAVQFVREHEGVRIIVVLDDAELLMRDATWFPQLQNFALDHGKTVVIRAKALEPQFMVIRATPVNMDETDERRGPKNPRLIEAWARAYYEVVQWNGLNSPPIPDTGNGWVSIEAQIRRMPYILSDVDFRDD